jgi:hypothetical protein
MIYVPVGRELTVRMDALRGSQVTAWWFDPRTGQATKIGDFAAERSRKFRPPVMGESLDWVLVLDDSSQGFPPPGQLLDR